VPEDFAEQLAAVRQLLHDANELAPAAKIQVIRLVQVIRSKLRGDAKLQLEVDAAQALGIGKEKLKFWFTLTDKELGIQLNGGPIAPTTQQRIPKGWLADYLQYTMNQESPLQFHFWVGVATIAAVLGRRVFFLKGHYDVVANHYIVLVAPSGRCRRSVATGIGARLLDELGNEVNILREKVTPEGLLQYLNDVAAVDQDITTGEIRKTSAAIIHAPELSVFLGKQQYNEGMIALLTTLYDSPIKMDYVTRTKDRITLQNVALSILGSSAPDWMAESLPQVAFGGGFLSRIIFPHRETTDRVIAIPRPPDETLRSKLLQGLREFKNLRGEFQFDHAGREWYVDWYERTKDDIPDDMRLSGYFERKQDHLLRLAMVLNVAGPRDLIFTPGLLQNSLLELESVEPELPRAFRQVGTTQLGRQHERMMSQIERAGGEINHSAWLRMNTSYMDRRMFFEAVTTMKQAGLVLEGVRPDGRTAFYKILREKEG